MDHTFLIGSSAAFLTTLGFFPQVIKTHRTKHTKDLSLIMYVLLCAGFILWIVYGLMLRQTPIVAANVITLALCLYIVFLKIKYG
jgi:MtN3 and saliva related transmembrane protein